MLRTRPFFVPVLILCAAASGLGAAAPRYQCWILIDFDAVFCAPCLEPLIAFCRALPEAAQDGRVLGIVVYRAPASPGEEGRRRKIVEAKWDGFYKAHGFRFPAVLDDGPVFRRWLDKGAAKVLFFDGPARAVREFDLPLRPDRFDEMLSLLLLRGAVNILHNPYCSPSTSRATKTSGVNYYGEQQICYIILTAPRVLAGR